MLTQRVGKATDQWFGQFGVGGVNKAGATPFAGIAVKGELRNDKRLASHVKQAQVQLVRAVFKDAQASDFARQPFGFGRPVGVGDAQQDHETGTDGGNVVTADGYRRFTYTLYHRAHCAILAHLARRPELPGRLCGG